MQFTKTGYGHIAHAVGSQPEYRVFKGSTGWVAQAVTPTQYGGEDVGYIGTYKTVTEAKKAARYAERIRLGDDPNQDRKAYLRAEINATIDHIVADAHAVAEAQATLERDTARLEKLQRELNGILDLEASA